MKKLAGVLLACMLVLPSVVWSEEKKDDAAGMTGFEQKLGYAMGLDVGNYFKGIGNEIDFDSLMKGLQDGFQGNEPALSAEDIAAVQKQFGEKMQAR